MDNQTYQSYTYEQSEYIIPEQNDVRLIVSGKSNQKNRENFKFIAKVDYKPEMLLLESIIKARKDREEGLASPVFSSVADMKKWVEQQND